MAEALSAIQWVIDNHEGGFQNNPNDSGNYDSSGNLKGTNWGISAPVAEDNGYDGDMRNFPKDLAIQIYQDLYWRGLDAVNSQAIATKILDIRVNFGVSGGNKILQRALNAIGNSVSVDGVWGPETESAVNASDPSAVMSSLVDRSMEAYSTSSGGTVFLSGWLKRAQDIPPETAAIAATGLGFGVLLLVGIMVMVARAGRA
jgi:lysozyme family protein